MIGSAQLAAWTKGRWERRAAPEGVNSIDIDARNVSADGAFVALRTGKRDGHEFVAQAAQAGAAAAIVERVDMKADLAQLVVEDTLEALHRIGAGQRKTFSNPLVAVTGSCGKTSTKDLLALLLGDNVLATQGNLNNYIGLPITLSRLRPEHRAAVVEIGISMSGEMPPLARIADPDYALVTSVAPAHLEGLGSLSGVAAEKSSLPATLSRDKLAVFPAYCLQWVHFNDLRSRCLVTASMDEQTPMLPGPNYRLARYQTYRGGESGQVEMLLFMPDSESFARFTLPNCSRGMHSNAALALALALEMGCTHAQLRDRIRGWAPSRKRGEVCKIGEVEYFVDCYNANPASMLDSAQHFRELFSDDRRLFMLGCMNELGPDSAMLHYQLGLRVGGRENETFCIVGHSAQAVKDGLVESGCDPEAITATNDAQEAKKLLDEFACKPGAVMLKGSRAFRMEDFLPATN
jgi:UDP-N-acetylmuramoyl-tripeptide--D-alanyl-D-alanine ligase